MRPVIWQQTASDDVTHLLRHIGREDPLAARLLKARLETLMLPLSKHPYVYQVGKVADTREIFVAPHYVVVYRVAVDRVTIVNVLHTRQECP